jgi:hypothetical protein
MATVPPIIGAIMKPRLPTALNLPNTPALSSGNVISDK